MTLVRAGWAVIVAALILYGNDVAAQIMTGPDVAMLQAQRNEALDGVAMWAAMWKAEHAAAAKREADWGAYSAPLWKTAPDVAKGKQ